MTDFTCACGNKDKHYGYKGEKKCSDCVMIDYENDKDRREEKIKNLVKKLKEGKILTHKEALSATTTSGFMPNNPNIGHVYLSKLLNKNVPYYNHNLVARVGEEAAERICLYNGYWPWAIYKRDSGDYGYICLIHEP